MRNGMVWRGGCLVFVIRNHICPTLRFTIGDIQYYSMDCSPRKALSHNVL